MLAPRRDDVSNIHRHWSVTRINPSSARVSYTIWIACAAIIVVVSHVYALKAGLAGLAIYLPLGVASLLGSHFLDYLALRGTPVRKSVSYTHLTLPTKRIV